MKKDNKSKINFKKIGVFFLILLFTFVAFYAFTSKNNNENTSKNKTSEEFIIISEDGTKQNISSKIAETKYLDGLEITNSKLTYKDAIKMTELNADVTNTSEKKVKQLKVRVHLLDKDGNELDYMDSQINSLDAKEKTTFNVGILADFSNAFDYTIEKIK